MAIAKCTPSALPRVQDVADRIADLRSNMYRVGRQLQSYADEFQSPDRAFTHIELFQRGLRIESLVETLERYADEAGAAADEMDPPVGDGPIEAVCRGLVPAPCPEKGGAR